MRAGCGDGGITWKAWNQWRQSYQAMELTAPIPSSLGTFKLKTLATGKSKLWLQVAAVVIEGLCVIFVKSKFSP